MALDGITLNALTNELSQCLVGARIDKIHQPERDEIIIGLRAYRESYKLLLCANPSFPRVHLTELSKDNPQTPPLFCMLLRKHISGGKITAVYQKQMERIICFDIESYDELGDLSTKTLIAEIMGKHSNIILINNSGKIIDSIFHVDITVSSVRQVLPGFIYEEPPGQGKIPLTERTDYDILSDTEVNEIPYHKQIMSKYMGISPLIARETVYNALGETDAMPALGTVKSVSDQIISLRNDIINHRYSPCIIVDKESGKPLDFAPFIIQQYENLCQWEKFDTMNEAVDSFYIKKAKNESMRQKSAALHKLVSNNIERCERKLQIQNETLSRSSDREKHKIKGDLITANLYRIKKGDEVVELENFYNNGEIIKITLKPDLTPSENAQRFYARYTKEKTAEEETLKQRKINLEEIEYLKSVLESIEQAETVAEINQIKEELSDEGYIRKRFTGKKSPKSPKFEPARFVSHDGFEIFAGKNNKQNDYVTLKLARSTDIWLHTKNIHGSHVIIKTEGGKEVPDRTLTEAAIIAAYFSKGKNSQNVEVDYTEVKNVKKPSGAKPGMVIYVNNYTAVVTPDEKLIEELRTN